MAKKEKKRGGCLKNILIVFVVLIILGSCTALFGDDTEPEEKESSNPRSQVTDEEKAEMKQEHDEKEAAEEETIDVIDIAESKKYVIGAELIEEDYTLGTDEDIQIFSPEDEKHYRIQMDHHGGLLGSKNTERIEELLKDISDKEADYDYLVFEILRTDNEDSARWVYTRFNQEQTELVLNEEEVNTKTLEEFSDFYIEGDKADIGFNVEAVNFDDLSDEEIITSYAESRFTGDVKELIVNNNNIEVRIEKGTSWSESSAVNVMKRDIALFLGDLHDYELNYNVLVTFEGTLVDQAGNESINDIFITEFSSETVKEINPENIDVVSNNLEGLSEVYWTHPAFR